MILQETYKLENGTKIPKLGLGTWCIDNDKAAQTVRTAVTLGYRLIDTAQAYENEQGVGEGIRSCSVSREELFVASKVAAELKTYEAAAASIEETLEKMGLDYLDQMIIHIPPEVKHWHGAAPDCWFSHLAVEVPGEDTSNEWCEPVPEETYKELR